MFGTQTSAKTLAKIILCSSGERKQEAVRCVSVVLGFFLEGGGEKSSQNSDGFEAGVESVVCLSSTEHTDFHAGFAQKAEQNFFLGCRLPFPMHGRRFVPKTPTDKRHSNSANQTYQLNGLLGSEEFRDPGTGGADRRGSCPRFRQLPSSNT